MWEKCCGLFHMDALRRPVFFQSCHPICIFVEVRFLSLVSLKLCREDGFATKSVKWLATHAVMDDQNEV